MGIKLNDLTSKFSDFLRPNLYAVYMFPKNNFANWDELGLGLLCHEASFPFHTFTTVDVWYNNHQNNFINKIDYDPITFTFFVDKFNKSLKFFDLWRQQIINDNHQIGFYDDYVSLIDIEILDRTGDTAAIATLFDAIPVNIDSVPLSYESNDQIMSISVSFQFKNIEYDFIDRTQQSKDLTQKVDKKSDFFSTVRKGVNLISKIKNYRYMVQNGNIYDVATNAGNIFATTSSGTRRGDLIEKAAATFK